VLRAIREEEDFARAFGKMCLRFKIQAFALSAALAALAGSLFAHYVSYIDPSSFTVLESILVISMVIVVEPGAARTACRRPCSCCAAELLRFVDYQTQQQQSASDHLWHAAGSDDYVLSSRHSWEVRPRKVM